MTTFETFEKYVIPNYTRYPVTLVKGEDSWIWDENGKKYLDFFPGWGCGMLGHCPKYVVEAVQKQVATLIHIPNSWYSREQGEWARLLSERSFGGKCFFCNSGTEANEAAIKLARMYGNESKRYKIVTFFNGFHGRTMGSVSATAQPKYQQGLGPLLPGFVYAPYGDLDAVKEIVENDDEIVSIMLEPIQGEGGVNVPPREFLVGLRELCDKKDILLHFDEVQTGFGRTGYMYAYEAYGVVPDILTSAKGLGAGIAIGAMMTTDSIADTFKPGVHGTTFGGNPLATAVGCRSFELVHNQDFLDGVKKKAELFRELYRELNEEFHCFKEVRGMGLLIGAELTPELSDRLKDIFKACLEEGLFVLTAGHNVIRTVPALNIPEEDIREGFKRYRNALKKLFG